MAHSKDYIGWLSDVQTLGDLARGLTRLTPDQIDFVCPKLKEWRERAIELQSEPAAMAAEQMRHWEEQQKLDDAWHRYQRNDLSQEEFEGTIAEIVAKRTPKQRHLYQNSEVIYCAESLDQCWELFEADMEVTRAEEEQHDPFVQIPDRKPLEVGSDEPTGEAGEVERTHQLKPGIHGTAPTFWYVTKTAAEWASGFQPGHFSGGDY